MKKLSKAWRRGLYPEPEPFTYHERQELVTISMDADLYAWLAGFVGRNSYTFCVEDAIITALRYMRGEEAGANLDRLAELVASERATSRIEAVFGEISEEPVRKAAGLLYLAAMIAASKGNTGQLDDLVSKESEDLEKALAALRVTLPDWNPKQQVAAPRAEEERSTAALVAEAEAEMDAAEEECPCPPRGRREDGLEDDIPF